MNQVFSGSDLFSNYSCFLSTIMNSLLSWNFLRQKINPLSLISTSLKFSGHKQNEARFLDKISHRWFQTKFPIEFLFPSEFSWTWPALSTFLSAFLSLHSHQDGSLNHYTCKRGGNWIPEHICFKDFRLKDCRPDFMLLYSLGSLVNYDSIYIIPCHIEGYLWS